MVGSTHDPDAQLLLIKAGPNVWPTGLGGVFAYQPVQVHIGSLEPWAPCPVDSEAGLGKACASICPANIEVKIKVHASKNSFIKIRLAATAY